MNEEAGKTNNTVKSILPTEQSKEIKEEGNAEIGKPDRKRSAVDKLFASK